jgi:hypothetical protein
LMVIKIVQVIWQTKKKFCNLEIEKLKKSVIDQNK